MGRELNRRARPPGCAGCLLPATDRNYRLAATLDDLSSKTFALVEKNFSDYDRSLRDGKRLRTSAGAIVDRHGTTERPKGVTCGGSCNALALHGSRPCRRASTLLISVGISIGFFVSRSRARQCRRAGYLG
jgi:hypothetical protein